MLLRPDIFFPSHCADLCGSQAKLIAQLKLRLGEKVPPELKLIHGREQQTSLGWNPTCRMVGFIVTPRGDSYKDKGTMGDKLVLDSFGSCSLRHAVLQEKSKQLSVLVGRRFPRSQVTLRPFLALYMVFDHPMFVIVSLFGKSPQRYCNSKACAALQSFRPSDSKADTYEAGGALHVLQQNKGYLFRSSHPSAMTSL